MIVVITNEGDKGYSIYQEGKPFPMKNMRRSFIGMFNFQDDDIENLLTPAQYKKFETGAVYQFNVTLDKLNFITGARSARNKQELELYND